jgi:hypothetical protein
VTFPHSVFLTHAEDVFHPETTRAGSRSSVDSRSGSALRSRQRLDRDELLFDFDLEPLLFDFDLDVVPFDLEPEDFDRDEPLFDFELDDFDRDVVPFDFEPDDFGRDEPLFDFELDDFDFDLEPVLFDFDELDFDRDELPFDFEPDDFDFDFDLEPLLLDFDELDFDLVPELLASPDCARCLLTVAAAISSARSSDRPASSSDSFTCSYWRSRFSLHAF